MELVIVESPTKARTLSRFLGKDFDVEATMGHIKDLPKSQLGIDIENNFKPDYTPIPKQEVIIKDIQSKSKKAQKIYLATDPDREGEAIAQHVADLLRTNLKLNRIAFHEITKKAVEEAIKHPRVIDGNLVDAQIARRVLDRLVGYKLSPLLWKKVRRGLSAGRVQSVAVRLIVEREREIKAFKSEEYWEIFVELQNSKNQKLQVQLIKIGDKKADIKDGATSKKIVADLEKASYKVWLVDKHEVRKNPYAPFTTSTMTQAAARIFFWSAKRTMSVAQKLYEEGLITYHRTDSTNLAQTAIEKVRLFIGNEYGKKYLPDVPKIYKTQSKVAQEAHEAIRPTDVNSKFKIQNSKFSGDAEKLYNLIRQRFVACQMATAVYDETSIEVGAMNNEQSTISYLLRASGQIMKFDGWRAVYGEIKNQNSPARNATLARNAVSTASGHSVAGGKVKTEEKTLPEVEVREALQLVKVNPFQKFTEPPPRFNEASLIKTLEKLGIGRPSTYAPIITTIQVRQYVEKEEGKFTPTPVGFAVSDFLVEHFPDVFDYAFTAEMENNLDEVANGKKKWENEIKTFWSPFSKKLESVTKKSKRVKIETEKLGKKCPLCKEGELVIRIGRFGKFVSCSRFPECKFTEKYIEKVGMKCPECKKGDVIIKKTKTRRNFFGCSRYPDCRWASWRNPMKNSEVSTPEV